MNLDRFSLVGIIVAISLLMAFIIAGNVNKIDTSRQIKGSNLSVVPLKEAERITIKTDSQGRVSLGAE